MTQDPILITGVGKRAGLHLAQSFLRKGQKIIGTYRSERTSIDDLKLRGAEIYRCDFNDAQQVAELISTIKQKHSRLRALIHNASEWLPDNADMPQPEIVHRMMQVHVNVPYQLNLALSPLLLAANSEHSDIVHVGDYVSHRGSKKHIAYAASKAAQDCLTMSFSAKLSPKVKVNSVAPALIMFNEGDSEAYREKALNKSLMKREAGLEEFGHAIDYLLQSNYITGRVLPLDGGRHLVQ